MRSIQRLLLAWVLSALALGAILVAMVTYLVTLDEMHEVLDDDLRNIALALAAYHQADAALAPVTTPAPPAHNEVPDGGAIVTLAWAATGELRFASDPSVRLPFSQHEGLSRPVVAGQSWIVYTARNSDGVTQAAQRLAGRRQMAAESAAQVLPPLIGLVFLVGGLLVFGLRRGLSPLDSTAKDVAQRSAHSLEPIALDDTPGEIAPLVHAINGLMARLSLAFAAQRQLLADTAHELRTPVTALGLQLQLLERSQDGAERQQAMADLGAGIQRTQRLIGQLLQAAQVAPDGEAMRREVVDLAALVRSVVATLSIKADHLGLDLGADAPRAVPVLGDAAQLAALLDNLVENALRYTPAGGVVDVQATLQNGHPVLRVSDTGPGIPADERMLVFERFYRGGAAPTLARDRSGSGLGLSIVKAIADRHGAQVHFNDATAGTGLVVEVVFPASDAADSR